MPSRDASQRLHRARKLSACLGMWTFATAVGPATADDALPQRVSGHWRLTSVSPASGMTTIEACIGPADSIATPAAGRSCAPPQVQRVSDQVIVNLTCMSALGEERISTLFTGDFRTWYRGITKMTFDPPLDGVAHLGVTVDAKFVGSACPGETKP